MIKDKKKLELLVKKAIRESDRQLSYQKFNPQAYLEGKINLFNCHHEVFLNHDSLHVCAICGFSLLGDDKLPNSIEFKETNQGSLLFIKSLLNLISNQYLEEEQIDLVSIFSQLEPHINQILAILEQKEKTRACSTRTVAANDSEKIAKLLEDFKYEPRRTTEVLKEYADS